MKTDDKELLGKEERSIMRALVNTTEGEGFDFECVAVPSDNKQLKYSWQNDEYFYQVLRTGSANIDTSRMDSGLPLFDNHPYDQSALNTLGITVGYDFTEEGIVMRTKLGARADEALRKDIKDKVIKTVSIEGDVLEYLIERKIGEIPVYYAELWQPSSLSLAPVPQDISSQIEIKRALARQLEPKQSFINSLTKNLLK